MATSIRTRLTLATAALLAGTAALVVGGVYLATAFRIEREARNAVSTELDALVRSWQTEGIDGLVSEVERRSLGQAPPGFAYLVTDRQRIRIAGNMREWPEGYSDEGGAGVASIDLRRADVWIQQEMRLQSVGIEDHHLLVGRDDSRDDALLGTLQASALGGIAFALLVAVGAGLAVSRKLLGRVEGMRTRIDAILGGAVDQRVEVGAGGDEFDDLASRFNHLLDENDRLVEQVREATSNIAHDLRTPLQRMRARLEAALAPPGISADTRDTLEALAGDTERLLETFNGLLQIARIEARELRRTFRPVPLSSLVQDVVELYGPLAEEAGLDIRVAVEPDLIVPAERQLLGQALANLVDNASKYAAGGGSIEVTTRSTRGGAEILVADHGPGIPVADRSRVLDRLVRLDESRGVPGTGLGLSFVSAVAQLHRGAVELRDNHPGLLVVLRLDAAAVDDSPGHASYRRGSPSSGPGCSAFWLLVRRARSTSRASRASSR